MNSTNQSINQSELSAKRGRGRRFDLTGEKFENLTVINLNHRKNQNRIWECLCDCGKKIFVASRSLNYGSVRSCGCLKGTGMQKPMGVAAFNKLFGRYKRFASKRRIEFHLTEEEFRSITSQKCHYCSSPPSQNMGLFFKKTGDYIHSGIDRMDSKKSYEIGNVVPCCGICNRAKMTTSYENFIEWLQRIRDNASHVNQFYNPVNKSKSMLQSHQWKFI